MPEDAVRVASLLTASVVKGVTSRPREFVLSTLGHTWILDLDGTIVKHNGYKLDGTDQFIPGAANFLASIPEKDMIVWITSRPAALRERTVEFLDRYGIHL